MERSTTEASGEYDESALSALLVEASQHFTEAVDKLGTLRDKATALASEAERELAQLQRFLEEFALEQLVYDRQGVTESGGTGPLFDIAAVRAEAVTLAEELQRSVTFRGNLESALQLVRSSQDQFLGARAFQSVHETRDLPTQQAMNSAREDERRRLAREIHDGPAQVLANAIFAVEIAEQVGRRSPALVADELSRIRLLLRDGVTEIRRFMFDLRPAMLQEQGLLATIRRYVEDYNRFFSKRVELAVSEGVPAMSPDQELAIFRIVQESLQNIHKHAMTDAAKITLGGDDGSLIMSIVDEGRGFSPDTIVSRPGSGAGLPGMRERAQLVSAELSIESQPGVGTVVSLAMAGLKRSGLQNTPVSGITA
ncbi:MAG: sensor histidine kinase [Chloroflexota bacterium]|nr:sensor histidine kinase [Chloroflexota bacterium]